MQFGFQKRGIQMLVVLAAMVLAGAAHAQTTTTTTQTKSFEILSVDGNVLVIREPEGTRELTVPSDFLFNVDGKSLAVSDLKPGMKGTAKVTKTTISRPVYVTEVKNVTVVETLGGSVIVQGDDGFKMYSQGELDKQGIRVLMGGKPVKLEDLREGDRLTASIVTEGPPQKMSKTEVDVTLAKAKAAAAAAPPKVATQSSSSEPAPAVETPAADTSAAPVADTSVAPAADTSAAPASGSSLLLWLGIIFIILVVVLVMRRRSKS